jgi:hypothetical protein
MWTIGSGFGGSWLITLMRSRSPTLTTSVGGTMPPYERSVTFWPSSSVAK